MIITGAPVEMLMEFEEVDYWTDLIEVMEWSKTNVTNTLYIYAGVHRLDCTITMGYINIGLPAKKLFGVFDHKISK